MEKPQVASNSRADNIADQFSADFKGFEEQLVKQHPGVLAVMETYALAQPTVQQWDTYMRVLDVRPVTRTSNGSA